MRTTLTLGAVVVGALFVWPATPTISAQALDYDYFKAKVQPIFLAKRPGHARCISCHGSGTPLRLQPLAPGAAGWSDDDSRKNFQAIQRVAAGGSRARLLLHPLEEKAGGDFYHSGGKHWASQSDPEWLLLKNWVMGQTQ